MGRAHGKHTPRKPQVEEIDPESPLGRQLGMSPRTQGVPSVIPGGRLHISNAPSVRQEVPIPDARPEYHDMLAHGVPPGTATTRERAEVERGPNSVHEAAPHSEKRVQKPHPIPVYVVQDGQDNVLRSASPRHFTLQASTGDPVRICGRDHTRTAVLILNESTSSDIRFAMRQSDLGGGGGALLPWPSNSYLRIDTQDELYAISKDSGTPAISVIQVFEREMGRQ